MCGCTRVGNNALYIDRISGNIVSDPPLFLTWTAPLGKKKLKRYVIKKTVLERHGKSGRVEVGPNFRKSGGFLGFGTLLLASEPICGAFAWQLFKSFFAGI